MSSLTDLLEKVGVHCLYQCLFLADPHVVCCSSVFYFYFFFKAFPVHFLKILFIYFIFGCVGSSLLRAGFLQLWRAGTTLCCGVWASYRGGFSFRGARAPGVQAPVVVVRGLQSAGSVVVPHGLSCSVACGIFPDQGSKPCPLHWQADS